MQAPQIESPASRCNFLSFAGKSSPCVPGISGKVYGTFGEQGCCARNLSQLCKHRRASARTSADDLSDGKLAVASQMPVAEATVNKQQFAALRRLEKRLEDHCSRLPARMHADTQTTTHQTHHKMMPNAMSWCMSAS